MSSKPKFHLEGPQGGPLCGRFLNQAHPTDEHHIRDASKMLTTQDTSQVQCKHCLRKAGLIAPIPKGGFLAERIAELSEDAEVMGEEE